MNRSHKIHGTNGIFTYMSHKNQPNVSKYTSPMDSMGIFYPLSSQGLRNPRGPSFSFQRCASHTLHPKTLHENFGTKIKSEDFTYR